MIQNCFECKHVRLVLGFVQACHESGATMAARTERRVRNRKFICCYLHWFSPSQFSSMQSPLWESRGKTINPVQVHCLRTALNTTSNVPFVWLLFMFFLLFGSRNSSPPWRWAIRDGDNTMPARYHRIYICRRTQRLLNSISRGLAKNIINACVCVCVRTPRWTSTA